MRTNEEAVKRARQYFEDGGKPFTGAVEVERLADLLCDVARETAADCSVIARRAGKIQVEAEIRKAFKLPREAPVLPGASARADEGETPAPVSQG